MAIYLGNEGYQLPDKSLLKETGSVDTSKNIENAERNTEVINQIFKNENIDAKVLDYTMGSAITEYRVELGLKTKVRRFLSIEEDLKLRLGSPNVVMKQIPNSIYMGISVPNEVVTSVPYADIVDAGLKSKDILEVPLGKDIKGKIVMSNLEKLPHLLVAGTTGSGKSVGINVIISSLLMKARPDEVKFVLVDPKTVEFSGYKGMPHLWRPVITDMGLASEAVEDAAKLMDERFKKMSELGVRNFKGYNAKVDEEYSKGIFKRERFFRLVIIIDELADLMMTNKEVETPIVRIGQKARAAGIHMILATQKPTVDVVTSLIKSNVPSRMAFAVASGSDSSVIIDERGAEDLLGYGDMLYKPVGAGVGKRVQGAFLDDPEVDAIVEHVKSQPWEEIKIKEDEDAKPVVVEEEKKYETRELESDEVSDFVTQRKKDSTEVVPPIPAEQPKSNKQEKETETQSQPQPTTKSNEKPKGEDKPVEEVLVEDIPHIGGGGTVEQTAADEDLGTFKHIIEDEPDEYEDIQGEVGQFTINNQARGRAFGPSVIENPQELIESVAADILTKGLHLLDLESEQDELFVRVEDQRVHNIGNVVILLFDLDIRGTDATFKKKQLRERGFTVSVVISGDNGHQAEEIARRSTEYFNKTYAGQSHLVNIGNYIVHGYDIKPFIKVNPRSPHYRKFLAELLKEQWLKNMLQEWQPLLVEKQFKGVYTVQHLASELTLTDEQIQVDSQYKYEGMSGSGYFEQKRTFDNRKLNNPRYEDVFNLIIDDVVVSLNMRYNKGVIAGPTFKLQFAGIYGVPKVWESIIATDNLQQVYDRAILAGLEPAKVNGVSFMVPIDEKYRVVCSGNGFYIPMTPVGYVKGVQALDDINQYSEKIPILKQIKKVYDLRVSLYQDKPDAAQ